MELKNYLFLLFSLFIVLITSFITFFLEVWNVSSSLIMLVLSWYKLYQPNVSAAAIRSSSSWLSFLIIFSNGSMALVIGLFRNLLISLCICLVVLSGLSISAKSLSSPSFGEEGILTIHSHRKNRRKTNRQPVSSIHSKPYHGRTCW